MYHNWVDRWDERRARRGDKVKTVTDFALGTEYAFPDAIRLLSIAEFCDLADEALADPNLFDDPSGSLSGFEREGEWIKFPSSTPTEVKENNVVWAKVTESDSFDQALVIFHHWNAGSWNEQIAKYFSRRGVTVVEIALPYHFQRSRPDSSYADYMIGANLGRTIQSMKQGVFDGRKLIRWLKAEGYGEISLLGMSLGSWVAGLIAGHDLAVTKAALFLTAGSLADMVWTGRATRSIRASLEHEIELRDLRKAWGVFDLENYVHQLARPELDLHIVLAKRDKVVLPELSRKFVNGLKAAGGKPDVLELNCGHYSLAMPPHVFLAGLNLRRLLMRSH